MWRDVLALAAILSLSVRPGESSPIVIHIRGERVDIRADNTPLVQILNGVAWEAKMKIVYDAPPPQDPVTVNIQNATLSQAITDLLIGHGLVYVAKMDAAGTRVDTLVLTSGNPGEVRLNAEAPPPPQEGEMPVEMPQEYVPEVSPDVPPSQPTPAPASAWTPQPVVLPGSAPSPSPTPFMPVGRMPPGYMGHGAPGAPTQYAPPSE
jgi:hypothetical protein